MLARYDDKIIFHLCASIRDQANQLIVNLLTEHGVTDVLPAHGAVLNALFEQSPLPMSKLGQIIGRRKNTVTSLIKTLEERGYCARASHSTDGRVQLIELTAKGQALRPVQEEISQKMLGQAWNKIYYSERQTCMRVLATILDNLQTEQS